MGKRILVNRSYRGIGGFRSEGQLTEGSITQTHMFGYNYDNSIDLPPQIAQALGKYCQDVGESKQKVIVGLLAEMLKRKKYLPEDYSF